MGILKQVSGIIGVIFGLLGVVLALAQIVGIWVAHPPITRGAKEVEDALLKGLLVAEQMLAQSTAQSEELSSRLATLAVNNAHSTPVWLAAQPGAPSRAQLEARLKEVETQLSVLSVRVSAARAQVAQAKTRAAFQINWSTVGLTLVYLWYGIAPFFLFILSWRWVRQPAKEQNRPLKRLPGSQPLLR